jgi:hypothetical protein
MIYLKANIILPTFNAIYLNLMDRVDDASWPIITPWSWLMVFQNDFSKERYTLLQVLGNTAYHSKINNTVKLPIVARQQGAMNGLQQEVELPLCGYYTYEIYEQAGFTNLAYPPAADALLVQKGKMLVYDEKPEVHYKSLQDGNPNNFIYVP